MQRAVERDGRADGVARRSGVETDAGLAIERGRELRGVQRFSHEAMATVFEVYAVHPDAAYAGQAAQAAFDLTDRLEQELSRFLPNSDITRINHLAAGQTTRVSQTTFECLTIARHMFDLTGGAFDIAIGSGLASLELDGDNFRVGAAKDGVRLDLGGIGKGYAVDLMAELFEEWGLSRVLVHGGFSSVLALDPPDASDGWPLTLSDPSSPSRVLARTLACQVALGASGLRKGDHIIDPGRGEPVRGRLATWVAVSRPPIAAGGEGPRIAPTTVADALTTAFMVLELDEIAALCERSPGVEAWILPEAGAGVINMRSAGLQACQRWRPTCVAQAFLGPRSLGEGGRPATRRGHGAQRRQG